MALVAITGGMYNSNSNPTLTHVTFSNNSAYADGGGMYNSVSNPALTNATFSDNLAFQQGGGMYNAGSSPMVTNATFSNNRAVQDGGGMCNVFGSSPALTHVVFSNNTAMSGGGMWNYDNSPTLNDVTFIENSANSQGGAIYGAYSTATLSNVTFSDNWSSYGGGMHNRADAPTLSNVTFSNNWAYADGGGMYNYISSPGLTNVSFVANSAGSSGGGISNANGSNPTVTNSVLWGNTAGSGGAQIANDASAATVYDSVIQGGCPAGNTCSNIITTDPLLGTLGNYGGATQTIPLLPGSSAIDAGNAGACAATDQRGMSRVGACDIGAYESRGFALAIASGNHQVAVINSPFANLLLVGVTSNAAPAEPVNGGHITFAAPLSGASVITTTQGVSITGGVASAHQIANGTPGPYQVTASARGANAVVFDLENKPATMTRVVSSLNPSPPGQAITFTAIVTETTGGAPVTSGTVAFQDGGSDIAGCAAQALNGSGQATCTTASLTVGMHTITAVFSGNAAFSPSTGTIAPNQVVNQYDQTISITVHAPATVAYGLSFTIGATATSGLAVTYSSGGGCANAGAVFTMTTGTGTCTVRYDQAGNSSYAAAPQRTETVTALKAGVVTTLASSLNPSTVGQSVTFTAIVTSTAGIPGGTVAFKDGGSDIAGCPAQALNGSGRATCATASLAAGVHTITAAYSGTADYAGSASAGLNQVIGDLLPTYLPMIVR
jgi:predicted outer membrane repeat protein